MRCLGTAQGLGTGRGRGRGHQRASWGVGQAVQVSPTPQQQSRRSGGKGVSQLARPLIRRPPPRPGRSAC